MMCYYLLIVLFRLWLLTIRSCAEISGVEVFNNIPSIITMSLSLLDQFEIQVSSVEEQKECC